MRSCESGWPRVRSSRSALLVPEPVDLPAAEAAAVLEQREVLARLGLEVEPFGGDTVLVRSLPAMLPTVEPDRLVRDLAEHLGTRPLAPTRDGLLAELLHMVACKAAIKAGQPLTPDEIDALLERRPLSSPIPTTALTDAPPRWSSPGPTWRSSSAGSERSFSWEGVSRRDAKVRRDAEKKILTHRCGEIIQHLGRVWQGLRSSPGNSAVALLYVTAARCVSA